MQKKSRLIIPFKHLVEIAHYFPHHDSQRKYNADKIIQEINMEVGWEQCRKKKTSM